MSESELIELLILSQSETAQSVMNLTAIVFAYVLVAYFVGEKLSKAWSIGVSVCYSLFIIPIFMGCMTGVGLTISLASTYVPKYPNGAVVDDYITYSESPYLVLIVVLLPIVVGWLGSLLYMHLSVRGRGSA